MRWVQKNGSVSGTIPVAALQAFLSAQLSLSLSINTTKTNVVNPHPTPPPPQSPPRPNSAVNPFAFRQAEFGPFSPFHAAAAPNSSHDHHSSSSLSLGNAQLAGTKRARALAMAALRSSPAGLGDDAADSDDFDLGTRTTRNASELGTLCGDAADVSDGITRQQGPADDVGTADSQLTLSPSTASPRAPSMPQRAPQAPILPPPPPPSTVSSTESLGSIPLVRPASLDPTTGPPFANPPSPPASGTFGVPSAPTPPSYFFGPSAPLHTTKRGRFGGT